MTYPNGNTTTVDTKKMKSEAKSAVNKAERAIDDVRSEGRSIAETVLDSALSLLPAKNTEEVRDMWNHTVHDVQSGLKSARESTASFVRKYPVYSLLGAAAIGAGAALCMTMNKSIRSSLSTESDDSVRYDS